MLQNIVDFKVQSFLNERNTSTMVYEKMGMSFLRAKFMIQSTQQTCTFNFTSTNEAITSCILKELPGEEA